MAKKNEKYSVGVDLGTASVGWAVVNNDYHIIKYRGRNMYGARLFEKGDTAQERRVSRNSRRRLKRRRQRITLLRELMADMVTKNDPNFFVHLDKSYLNKEDKQYAFNLFNDKEYNDQMFYEEYPTMYHLRKDLCSNKEKADARLIYLALHHILKYRGNFLYEGQSFEVSSNAQTISDIKEALHVIFIQHEIDVLITDDEINSILKNLLNFKLKKGNKKDIIIDILTKEDKDAKKAATEFANLLLGYECNLTKLFPLSNIQKEEKDYKTNFDSTKYEDDLAFIELNLKESFDVLQQLHNVYSFCVLQKILKGEKYICDAMIQKYESHKQDLEELKAFIKKYFSMKTYSNIFKDKDIVGNYYNYINNARTTSRQVFYDYIKKTLSKNEEVLENETFLKIIDKIEKDEYFLRQNAKDNGTIPYQMHEKELLAIVNNQKQYYLELEDNQTKILSLLNFRIPYYVGPLNNHSDFSWIIRNNNEKIRPWNFNDNVDVIGSAEQFIKKMTNRCTYLLSEDVVPKCSLLYARFEVLNELNKIRIKTNNNEKPQLLNNTVKEDILNEVFLEKKKVRKKDIIDFLTRKQIYATFDIVDVIGFQKEDEFASSLTSWIDFKKIYEDKFESSRNEIEKLIEWISVYEDKKILKKRIEIEMPHLKEKMNIICKLRYSGWGRLSKALLCDLKTKTKDGKLISMMDVLETTSNNFMQIINDKAYDFQKLIEEKNDFNEMNTITYDMVKELQGSPAIKKGIWQTIQILNEIKKVMGKEPENIFIEFARSDEDSIRTASKVKKLQDIYGSLKRDGVLDAIALEASNSLSKEDKSKKLIEEKLYLYYLQEGKCLYSGKPLDIRLLQSYQVDHILPQSYIKDDSIDNKALVLSKENQYKGDNLLLSYGTVQNQKTWWEHLQSYGLMSAKKLRSLMRTSLSEKEEVSFINRQLVETRQITKHVANLLKQSYKNTNVVAIKASLSSIFREKYELYKVRDINDYHHAQDAYLATIIGTYVMKKYPVLKKEFIFSEYLQLGNFKKDLTTRKNRYGFIVNQMGTERVIFNETGEVIWNGEETLKQILKVFEYKDCFITKKTEEKLGQLFDLTIPKLEILKKSTLMKAPHKVIAVNKDRVDVQKYGGFTGLKYAYGIAVEYEEKNKKKRIVLNVPRHLVNDHKKLMTFLISETGAKTLTILKEKILLNQLFEVDGGLYTMASAGEWNNARQLILSKGVQKIVYNLLAGRETKQEDVAKFYDEYLDKLEKYYPLMKSVYVKLKENKNNFLNSPNQVKIVSELLKITKANPSYAVLTYDDFKISPSAGRMNCKTIDLSKTEFIALSITGMFTKRYKL